MKITKRQLRKLIKESTDDLRIKKIAERAGLLLNEGPFGAEEARISREKAEKKKAAADKAKRERINIDLQANAAEAQEVAEAIMNHPDAGKHVDMMNKIGGMIRNTAEDTGEDVDKLLKKVISSPKFRKINSPALEKHMLNIEVLPDNIAKKYMMLVPKNEEALEKVQTLFAAAMAQIMMGQSLDFKD